MKRLSRFAVPLTAVLLLISTTLAAAPAEAAAQACQVSQLINSSGIYVRLSTGILYETYPGRDRVAAYTWLPLDKVQVCHFGGTVDTLTDLSRPGTISIKAINLMLQ